MPLIPFRVSFDTPPTPIRLSLIPLRFSFDSPSMFLRLAFGSPSILLGDWQGNKRERKDTLLLSRSCYITVPLISLRFPFESPPILPRSSLILLRFSFDSSFLAVPFSFLWVSLQVCCFEVVWSTQWRRLEGEENNNRMRTGGGSKGNRRILDWESKENRRRIEGESKEIRRRTEGESKGNGRHCNIIV